ncbi:MAG: hypothetical protein KIG62_06000 [Oscillospiraceae bacterium]|nr:hypothetical protein [Oscillospiraceae bacterium]
MATVGNMASMQVLMARAQTRYSGLNTASASTVKSKNPTTPSEAQKQLDKMLDTTLKGKSADFREKYTALYKQVFGLSNESKEKADSTVSLKTAAKGTADSAGALRELANGLTYGGKVDSEAYTKAAEKFAESYNSMIESSAESDSNSVLQKGVLMVNTTKVYSSALKRAGFTLGSDNKLTFDKSGADKIRATDIKTLFGSNGYSDKVIRKAQQINAASGSLGAAAYTGASTPSYSYNIGALFSTLV